MTAKPKSSPGCTGNNIVSLLARARITGHGMTASELSGFSQHLMESVEGRTCRLILDEVFVLAALPDGKLIIKGNTPERSAPVRLLGVIQGEHWELINLLLPDPRGEVIVLDSSQFIVKNYNTYTCFLEKNGVWVPQELGQFSRLLPIGDGRFVTTPFKETVFEESVGFYYIWSLQGGLLVASPLCPADDKLLVLETSNRIISFHSNGIMKIWTESDGVWTPAILFQDLKWMNVRKIFELRPDRLVSAGFQQFGLWSLISGSWSYTNLMPEVDHTVDGLTVLGGGRFVTWHWDRKGIIRLWSEQEDRWQFTVLGHSHQESIKGVLTINKNRFVTWSSDSALVWTCQEDCTFVELQGSENIERFYLLSGERLVSLNYEGSALHIWYEQDSLWQSQYLGPSLLVVLDLHKLIELPQGYLAFSELCRVSRRFVTLVTKFFDLFPRGDQKRQEFRLNLK